MLYIYNFFTFYYFRNKNNYLFLSFSVFYRGLYLLVYCKITNNQLILNHIRIKFIGYAIFLLITKIILYIYKIFLNLQKHFVTCKILLPLFFFHKKCVLSIICNAYRPKCILIFLYIYFVYICLLCITDILFLL